MGSGYHTDYACVNTNDIYVTKKLSVSIPMMTLITTCNKYSTKMPTSA